MTLTISGRCRAIVDVSLICDAEDVVWVREVAWDCGKAISLCEKWV
jgi:hypothetical protein